MPTQVYLLFDERMALHRPIYNPDNPDWKPFEHPDRIFRCYARLLDLEMRLARSIDDDDDDVLNELVPRFVEFPCKPVDRKTVELVHSREHYDWLFHTAFMTERQLVKMANPDDLYICQSTFMASTLACGGVVDCVNKVTANTDETTSFLDDDKKITRAIALVRPPGHHAEENEAMGFCFINNCAVAAKHAIHTNRAKRVFILDWDIHHGNGIQNLTYDDPNIFYLSIHRTSFQTTAEEEEEEEDRRKHRHQKKDHQTKEEEWFYPGTGRPTETGADSGTGTNLNLVWTNSGMGNEEYATAFTELVLPVLSSFKPDLILVACGLDAAKGDLLGDCGLSPDMFYCMTKSLLDQAGTDIPIVVVLEGGYNVHVSAECLENVALALLDEPCRNGQYYDLSRYYTSGTITSQDHDGKKRNSGGEEEDQVTEKKKKKKMASVNKKKQRKSNKRKKKEVASHCIRQTALALEEAERKKKEEISGTISTTAPCVHRGGSSSSSSSSAADSCIGPSSMKKMIPFLNNSLRS